MKKILSVLMVTLVLVHFSFSNQAAIGSYKVVDREIPVDNTSYAPGALPAIAVAVIGASALLAFGYGVYAGYQEAAAAAGEALLPADLEDIDYNESDFSKFDA